MLGAGRDLVGTSLGFGALAVVATASALWFRRVAQVRIPENRAGFVAAWAGGALLGGAAFASRAGLVGGIAAALAIAIGTFLVVLVAISAQKAGAGAVRVGSLLPGFRAPDEHGAIFDLASLAGHPILLKFFRGHW